VLLVRYSVDQIQDNKMSSACSTYGLEEKCVQGFSGENLRKEKENYIKMDLREIV